MKKSTYKMQRGQIHKISDTSRVGTGMRAVHKNGEWNWVSRRECQSFRSKNNANGKENEKTWTYDQEEEGAISQEHKRIDQING